ncbi:hypothetical protein [Okeania sp.]|uniref:hypothetical protein n=1 Tax=Okeania sp. TaxID=3100323 RepID=UPI002B4B76B4|nr:hypothetical protein [Okeania sp.]MEB3342652.1 hypothetical protein [Okeania sp.]
MQTQTVTLEIPEAIYQRLVNTAIGMKSSVEDIVIPTFKVENTTINEDIAE